MKNRFVWIGILALGIAAGTPQAARAEDQTNAAPTRLTREQWQKLTPEERETRRKALREQREGTAGQPLPTLREQFREMSPAEREAKFKELRAQQGLPPLSPELQQRREELMKLPPEERRAKIAEIRKSLPAPAPVDQKAREQRRAALQKKLAELRAQKAEGKLSPEDAKRLEQLERFDQVMKTNPPPTKPITSPAGKTEKSN